MSPVEAEAEFRTLLRQYDVDGEAEVSDKATADALRALPAELGVREVGGRPAKDPTQT